jgi:hypothetical protein
VRFIFFLTVTCFSCEAQWVSFGAIGGGRATDQITSPAIDESKRYILGPMIDIGLPLGFGFEFDALYSRDGFRASNSTPLASTFLGERTNTWEFPLLVKHSLPFPIVKPFIEIGYAPRVMRGWISSAGSFPANAAGQFQLATSRQNVDAASQGFVLGGGVRFGAGPLRLSPEIRYTRWNNSPVNFNFPDGPGFMSTRNQVDLLVGIGWKVR